MKYVTGFILFIIFLILSVIHFYWALGGTRGINAAVPTRQDNKKVIIPGPPECFAVALVLLAFATFCLVKTKLIPFHLSGWLFDYGLWIITALFLLRAIGEFKYVGFFKEVNTTKFGKMDTKYYSPLSLLISILAIILELLH
jgi:Protein of unknown function (DUF3995)